ncbi:hypothetical protein Lser_V15G26860 [Lactuca serriola]
MWSLSFHEGDDNPNIHCWLTLFNNFDLGYCQVQ